MTRRSGILLAGVIVCTCAAFSAGPRAAAAEPDAKPIAALRICGDPGNMPLSNQKGEGFENKIAEALADALGTKVSYFWRPYIERGMTRQTFDTNDCDVLMDMPADYESLLTTFPIYRSTYVLAYRSDRNLKIKNLDDAQLKRLKVGVFETSALREALANHGVKNNVAVHVLSHDADLVPAHQPWVQVQQVVDGTLDVAAVWGPFAGWLKTMHSAPLTLQPTNRWDDDVPMEFDMAIGTRRSDPALKKTLEGALLAKKDVIRRILNDYGVPLVNCKECLIDGDLPAHGAYAARALQAEERPASSSASVIPPKRVAQWLSEGADPTEELSNAVLAVDAERVKFLLRKGVNINQLDRQGYAPLHTAARGGNTGMVALLLDQKADPNVGDADGWTPLLHAILRNRLDAVKLLLSHGADLERPSPEGFSPLQVAIEEGRFAIAQSLIASDASVNASGGPEQITPLMITASIVPRHPEPGSSSQPSAVDVARDLIERGAQLNAASSRGVTALMIAAARDNGPMIALLLQAGSDLKQKSRDGQTALDIAQQNGNAEAIKTLTTAAGRP